MDGLIPILFQCGAPVLLLLLGLLIGRSVEAAHLRRLGEEERRLFTIPVTDTSTVATPAGAGGGAMVCGSVVIASDYFKTFAASLRKLIGGELRSYHRLMERARREAICRMLRDAHQRGAMAVLNVRLETSNIGAVRSRNPAPMVEVVAYGTAVLPQAGAAHG